ncbi:AB hydrolase superfamily protein YdjP [Acaryochloris thomasi RCC1774]|uniref:AB hydrolase superfamily protein YdjP n=1 Tax=Acaryochloris thomasi RCC1774 TaxID=1764569 RepID=A0A2W1JFR7_9CYAN|nr:alpha/beta hydrolase [Acaryochloris thomasi]PZD72286.1 AB hydrolase superfamily protein YdjP [Acaryochloris thomasi RCC1774]
MTYVNVRDIPHYFEWVVSSREQYPTGKPVMVFLHGWGGSGRYWQSTAAALTDNFDCLLYDQRGFGRSRGASGLGPNVYDLEAYADDLAALLDELDLERVYLNAHSMGASIAALFLNQYVDRVDRAILTCNGLFEYDEVAFSQFHKFGQYVVKFRPAWLTKIPGADRMFMARFLHRSIPAPLRQAFLEDFVLADYDAALGTMLEAVSKKAALEMPQEYTNFKMPVLLISGEFDRIITAEMGKQAAILNPLVTYRVIAGTGHFPMLEDAPTYLDQVQQFLELAPA